MKYLPKFDGFKVWKRYEDEIFRNTNNNVGSKASSDVVKHYLYQYYIHYGADYLMEQAHLNRRRVNIHFLQEFLEECQQVVVNDRENLLNSLTEVGLDQYYPLVESYIPLTYYSLKSLIAEYLNNIPIQELPKVTAYLIWLYMGEYVENGKYWSNDLYKITSAIIREVYFDNRKLFCKSLFSQIAQLLKSDLSASDSELYPFTRKAFEKYEANNNIKVKVITDSKSYPSNGTFHIPWEYVRFMNEYMFIYHPLYPDGGEEHHPYRYEDLNCTKSLNHIKGYIVKKLNPIKITAKDGQITNINNIDSIREAVIVLGKALDTKVKLSKSDSASELKSKQNLREQDPQETLRILRLYKSQYLKYLSEANLILSKIYLCNEVRHNSNDNIEDEVSFIFTIKSTNDKVLVRYSGAFPPTISLVIRYIFLAFSPKGVTPQICKNRIIWAVSRFSYYLGHRRLSRSCRPATLFRSMPVHWVHPQR